MFDEIERGHDDFNSRREDMSSFSAILVGDEKISSSYRERIEHF